MLTALLALTDAPAVADRDPYRQPEIRGLMAAVTFYLSFDSGLQPDLAAGAAFAPRLHGDFAGTTERPDFADGLLGRALVLGTGNAMYATLGNAPLLSRGAAAFWIKPEKWRQDQDGNSVFLYAGRHFIVERQGPLPGTDGRRGRQASILCIGSGQNQKRSTSIAAADLRNGTWYFVVVNWSWPRLEMSINGAAPKARSTAGRPPPDAFPWFSVGSRGGSRALMDELLVFKRPLTPAEVRNLHDAFRAVR